jgi:hexosaminidase
MDESRLLLVPLPRRVERQVGQFRWKSGAQVVLYPPDIQSLLGVAVRLCDAVAAEAAVAVQVAVGEIGDRDDVAATLAIDAQAVKEEQGYVLDIDDERVSIVGHDAAGVFYGVCTLGQLLRQFGAEIPCLLIRDYPDFPARGVMLDISRCKVPTLETLMNLVDMLAGFKINQFQLYTEHTFAYREHREAWANASPITGQEILELDAYCRERFVELVPNQNSFGHLHAWLTHPKYRHLAECPEGCEFPWGGHSSGPFSLNPTDPESLDLLRSMYDDLLPHFSSGLFNVGCDETWDLGQGQSKPACEERGVNRVYLGFLLQIHQLVRERGRRMMFWGDIILHEPELIPELPKDAIALEWGYEHDHAFADRCSKFADAGIPFYVCPGTSSWNAVVGRTDNAMGNLRSAAENGLKYGAIGYLNTNWGDNDHWQYQPTAYLGYVYGAAVSWAFEANAGIDLPSALSMHVFGDATETMGRLVFDLGNVYKVYERVTGRRVHNANFLVRVLYQPVEELSAQGVDWKTVNAEVFREARQEIEAAMALLPQTRMGCPDAALVRREYENAARLLLHACALGVFKVGLATLPPTSSVGQRSVLARQASALAEDMRAILDEHRALWLARNRVSGLEKGSAAHFRGMIDAYWRIAQEMQG